jgi:hypothetical protein
MPIFDPPSWQRALLDNAGLLVLTAGLVILSVIVTLL